MRGKRLRRSGRLPGRWAALAAAGVTGHGAGAWVLCFDRVHRSVAPSRFGAGPSSGNCPVPEHPKQSSTPRARHRPRVVGIPIMATHLLAGVVVATIGSKTIAGMAAAAQADEAVTDADEHVLESEGAGGEEVFAIDPESLLATLRAIVRQAKGSGANIAQQIVQEEPLTSSTHFSLALRALRLEGESSAGVPLIAGMDDDMKSDIDFFSVWLKVLEDCKKWYLVIEAFDDMKRRELTPTRECYEIMLMALGEGGFFDRSASVVSDMGLNRMEPDLKCYQLALSCCRAAASSDTAQRLMTNMQVQSVQPDLACYNSCLRACCRARKWEAGLAMFQRMRHSGVRADEGSVSLVLRGCLQSPECETTAGVFNDIEASEGRVLTSLHYDMMIAAAESEGEWQDVMSYAGRMGRAGIAPLPITSDTVLAACAELHQWQPAVKLINSLKQDGSEPELVAYSAAMRACASEGEWTEVLQLHEDAIASGKGPFGVEILLPTVAAMSELGFVDDAVSLYREATREGRLRLWRQRRLGTGPSVIDARELPQQVLGVALRAAIEDVSEALQGKQDQSEPLRRVLGGFDAPRPEDIIIIVSDGETSEDQAEAKNTEAAETTLALVRELISDNAQVEWSASPPACIRIPGSELQRLLVKRVQKAVSDFVPRDDKGGLANLLLGDSGGGGGSI